MNIFNKIKEKKNKFFSSLKTNKKLFSVVISILILVVVLIAMSCFSDSSSSSSSSESETVSSSSDYATELETKLTSMLLQLDSITSASVLVVVESTPQIQYLTDTEEVTTTNGDTSTSTITTTVVYEKNGSVSTPVVVTTLMPKVTGVLIITNKISASTKLSIISSISSVLNIDQSCISLLQEG